MPGQHHLLLQIGRHVHDLDGRGVDAVALEQGREQLSRRGAGRRAQGAPDDILERLDRAVRLGDQRKGRAVVHHEHHGGLFARPGTGNLDDRIHIAEAGVIGTGQDARHRCGGALSLVDGDSEILCREVTPLLRPEHERMNALIFPVENEADRHLLLGKGWRNDHHGQNRHQAQQGPLHRPSPSLCHIHVRRRRLSSEDQAVHAMSPAGDATCNRR